MNASKINRWYIALMGTVLQLVLGTVYAWSFFQRPIMQAYGWNNVQVMWIFSIAIVFLGLTAAAGGFLLPALGPRRLAVAGVILYGCGYMISALAMNMHNLPLFYLGFGVVGGMGLGLGYVTPVATISKWFPDKKGLVTGMVIMGFGMGAMLMSVVIAPVLLNIAGQDLVLVFLYSGFLFLLLGIPAAFFMRNPADEEVQPYRNKIRGNSNEYSYNAHYTLRQALLSGKYIKMWLIFFLNISAGIIFIGWQSPMLQDLIKMRNPAADAAMLAQMGAALIAVSALFNGLGRIFWGWFSDRIGRIQTFRFILASQMVVFILLVFTSNPWVFAVMVCWVLFCYGGGFGTMPSFVLEVYGPMRMAAIYGSILTAWSVGGIAGPQIAAFIKDRYAAAAANTTFYTAAIFLLVALTISFTINNMPFKKN